MQARRVVSRRMTTRIADERIVCRSVIRVRLIIAGVPLNKRYTVMHLLHGGLLIEMEDNGFCRQAKISYFLSLLVFLLLFFPPKRLVRPYLYQRSSPHYFKILGGYCIDWHNLFHYSCSINAGTCHIDKECYVIIGNWHRCRCVICS